MNKRITRARLAFAGALVVGSALLPAIANASHGLATLPGSTFEIDTNANLVRDHADLTDWVNVTEDRGTDLPTGANDDSYQGGTKEDTACPGQTTGSIPNNKSDLRTFHVYREPGTGGHPGFLNLAWSRVTDPTGTTLMDFEFNQSKTACAVGSPNRVRTQGDLLIEYLIDQGGARADITARFWSGSAWGAPQDIDSNTGLCAPNPCAAGTINSSPILAAASDGIISSGQLNARTFGEAQIDLRLIFQANKCASFGSAMLKSRSSDSFTSQLKDFIRPKEINLTNCGRVIIHKETLPDEDPSSTDFSFTKSFSTDPANGNTFTLKDDGTQTFSNVLFGSGYTVTEGATPGDYALDSVDCSASIGVTPDINGATVTFGIDADTDVLECTYYNKLQQGALRILKNSTKGGGSSAVTNEGAEFSYDGTSVTDGGDGDEDADVGEVCVSGLAPGDYEVNETSPPPGYGGDTGGAQTVTVVAGTNCDDNQPGDDATATFVNPPLSDIQVNFRDGGSGETFITSMTCDDTGVTGDTTTSDGWDDSVTYSGIEIDPSPRTIVCTIEIDP